MNKSPSQLPDLILPCRVTGTRLYGKPLQYIDIEKKITIVEHQTRYFTERSLVGNICLAISDEEENYGFIRLAQKKGWKHVMGHPLDVLGRVVKAIDQLSTKTMILISTENPFIHTENLASLYKTHIENNFDFSMESDLPEGAGVAVIKADVLRLSHQKGTDRHRSELVTSYIFDHKQDFRLNIINPPQALKRPDVRITVDYPEDLTFCRQVYQALGGRERLIPVGEIVEFWDKHPELRKPVENIGIDWGHGRLWD